LREEIQPLLGNRYRDGVGVPLQQGGGVQDRVVVRGKEEAGLDPLRYPGLPVALPAGEVRVMLAPSVMARRVASAAEISISASGATLMLFSELIVVLPLW